MGFKVFVVKLRYQIYIFIFQNNMFYIKFNKALKLVTRFRKKYVTIDEFNHCFEKSMPLVNLDIITIQCLNFFLC